MKKTKDAKRFRHNSLHMTYDQPKTIVTDYKTNGKTSKWVEIAIENYVTLFIRTPVVKGFFPRPRKSPSLILLRYVAIHFSL